jgi:PAS domain-containing protein
MLDRTPHARMAIEGHRRQGAALLQQQSKTAQVTSHRTEAGERPEPEWQKAEHRYQLLLTTIAERVWRFELAPALDIEEAPEVLAAALLRRARMVECNPPFSQSAESTPPSLGLWLSDVLMGTYPEQLQLLEHFVSSGFRLVDVKTTEWDASGQPHSVLTNLVGIVEDDRLVGLWGAQRSINPAQNLERQPHLFSRQLSESVTLVNREGTILFESPGMEQSLGVIANARKGRNLFDEVHPGDVLALREVLDQVVLTPGATSPILKVRERRANGIWKPFALVLSHLADVPGPPVIAMSMLDLGNRRGRTEKPTPTEETGIRRARAKGICRKQRELLESSWKDVLTTIGGYAQMGLETCGARSSTSEDLQKILDIVQNASEMVRQKLESKSAEQMVRTRRAS